MFRRKKVATPVQPTLLLSDRDCLRTIYRMLDVIMAAKVFDNTQLEVQHARVQKWLIDPKCAFTEDDKKSTKERIIYILKCFNRETNGAYGFEQCRASVIEIFESFFRGEVGLVEESQDTVYSPPTDSDQAVSETKDSDKDVKNSIPCKEFSKKEFLEFLVKVNANVFSKITIKLDANSSERDSESCKHPEPKASFISGAYDLAKLLIKDIVNGGNINVVAPFLAQAQAIVAAVETQFVAITDENMKTKKLKEKSSSDDIMDSASLKIVVDNTLALVKRMYQPEDDSYSMLKGLFSAKERQKAPLINILSSYRSYASYILDLIYTRATVVNIQYYSRNSELLQKVKSAIPELEAMARSWLIERPKGENGNLVGASASVVKQLLSEEKSSGSSQVGDAQEDTDLFSASAPISSTDPILLSKRASTGSVFFARSTDSSTVTSQSTSSQPRERSSSGMSLTKSEEK